MADDDRVGLDVKELVAASTERNGALETPYVELWVEILDELISWQVSLLNVVYAERIRGAALSDFERSVSMVLMKVIADSTAIRHLILLGYDTSARAILRSTGEYLEVLVALLDDPGLACAFVDSDTPEGAKSFWETHLRGDKIRRRIKRAWRQFFKENPEYESTGLWFAGWGAGFQMELSSLLHPSFAGGMLTALTGGGRRRHENWLGVWGGRSDASVETVLILASFMFPVLLLHPTFPFEGFEDHLGACVAYDERDELHRHVRIGRNVLGSLILSLCKESNAPHVFPEEDWSWLEALPKRADAG